MRGCLGARCWHLLSVNVAQESPGATGGTLQSPEQGVKPIPACGYPARRSFPAQESGVTSNISLKNQAKKPETPSESLACCYQGH